MLLIVAIPESSDCQVPPDSVEDRFEVPPTQIACVPPSEPADGAAVTVTVLVAVALEHPPVPVIVYVIVAVPAETPVTTPVELLIVATPVLPEDQAPPELPLVVKVVVPLLQIA